MNPGGDAPSSLGKYRILRVVGRGGMGVVYEAEDPALGRRVALKVLRESDVHPQLLKRFQREAMIAAQLRHPNIVPVHEVAAEGPWQFMVMDYIEGTTLEGMLRKRADRDELLRILEDVGVAVGHAHEHGVVHRDLKPANVLVDAQGRVFLTDFGLAHVDSLEDRLTKSNAVMGTPMYMAPEQVAGKTREIDARTDVYALGVLLYEILAGRLPFRGETPAQLYSAILNEEPETISDVERDLQVLCLKALEKRREARYANGKDFAADLRRFRAGEPIRARPRSAAAKLGRKLWRHRAVLIPSLAAAALAAALLWPREKPRPPVPLASAPETENEARALINVARRALDAETYYYFDDRSDFEAFRTGVREALPLLEKAAARAPDLAEPHYHLGRAWEHLGEDDRAIEAWREAVRIQPSYPDARYELGRILLVRAFLLQLGSAEHQRERTRPEAERLIAEAKGHLEHAKPDEKFAAEALLQYVRGEGDAMRTAINEAWKRFEGKRGVEDVFWLAGVAEAARRMEYYDEALRIRPRFPLALHCRGSQLLLDGKFEKAEEDFSKAIALRPNLSHAYVNRGACRMQTGRSKEAIADFTRALEIRPDDADVIVNRGGAKGDLGDREGARADYGLAIRKDPRAPGAHYNLGVMHLEDGEPAQAIAEFTRELEHTPDHSAARQQRAEARRQSGDAKGALAEAEELIRLKPDDPMGYETRAMMHAAAGEFRLAADDFGRAIERNPRQPGYYVNRAIMRYQVGEKAEAIADFEKALELAPKNWPMREKVRELIEAAKQEN